MEDDYATGMATTVKSGNNLSIHIPKMIERYLKLERGDIIKIRVFKTGMKSQIKRTDAVQNFQHKGRAKIILSENRL